MIDVVLVYRKDDESLGFLRSLLSDFTEITSDFKFTAEYNLTSSKFLEKRTANSLLSQHGTVKTPLILFKKEGIIARAVYKEELTDETMYLDLITKKFLEARTANIEALRPLEVEDFGIDL